jgi:ribonucleoside-triphosphate reductase
MALGVAKTYRKAFGRRSKDALEDLLDIELEQDTVFALVARAETASGEKAKLENTPTFDDAIIRELMADYPINRAQAEKLLKKVKERSFRKTDRDTKQAMEGFVHNLNTMHSRAGAQTPFSSINYGTDTTPEGRMVIKNILLALNDGMGHGETCIFPIHIFKVKEGVNYNEGDPNYDLFRLSCKVSAKRLFPNYTFLDAPFNLQYYVPGRPETEVATMGCRTRVMGNVYDPTREISYSRGNLSFTSINLPRLAIEGKGDEKVFYEKLQEMLELVAQQLLDRFEIQASKHVYNYPFLMGQGVWLDADKLSPNDTVREVLKHGTLSIGFIGLAETLTALYGKHHGESEEIQEKGKAILSFMRKFCDDKSQELKMNFSLLGTPAEGLSGRFIRMDQKRYGKLAGITDREYYTNSFHIPVWYPISAYDKIRLEAPYHALCNAGHISYVELDGDTAQNVEAFETIVRCMHDFGIGYGSINHPVDRDPVCGYVGIIGDVCPRCGRREGEEIPFERIEELRRKYPKMPAFQGID